MEVRWLFGKDIEPLKRYLPEFVAVTIALSAVPLLAGVVPPNWLYGFRTPATMASPDAWYPANRLMGCYLLGSQLLAVASLNAVSGPMHRRFGRDRATWGVLWACVTSLAGIGACAIHYSVLG